MSTADKLPRWYFGGLASAFAACFTHPLDLIKVQLQTRTGQVALLPLAVELVRKNGTSFHLPHPGNQPSAGVLVGLYSGISASLFRQLTYSTIRFAIYDTAKLFMSKDTGLGSKMGVAFMGGALGGFVGTPPDKVNVRMQNDVKLPPEKRLKYDPHPPTQFNCDISATST